MSEDNLDICVFCGELHTTVKSNIDDTRQHYIYECNECKRTFCCLDTPYSDERDDITCGRVDIESSKVILCKICDIIKSGTKDKWLKVNGYIYRHLTGSNVKSARS